MSGSWVNEGEGTTTNSQLVVAVFRGIDLGWLAGEDWVYARELSLAERAVKAK